MGRKKHKHKQHNAQPASAAREESEPDTSIVEQAGVQQNAEQSPEAAEPQQQVNFDGGESASIQEQEPQTGPSLTNIAVTLDEEQRDLSTSEQVRVTIPNPPSQEDLQEVASNLASDSTQANAEHAARLAISNVNQEITAEQEQIIKRALEEGVRNVQAVQNLIDKSSREALSEEESLANNANIAEESIVTADSQERAESDKAASRERSIEPQSDMEEEQDANQAVPQVNEEGNIGVVASQEEQVVDLEEEGSASPQHDRWDLDEDIAQEQQSQAEQQEMAETVPAVNQEENEKEFINDNKKLIALNNERLRNPFAQHNEGTESDSDEEDLPQENTLLNKFLPQTQEAKLEILSETGYIFQNYKTYYRLGSNINYFMKKLTGYSVSIDPYMAIKIGADIGFAANFAAKVYLTGGVGVVPDAINLALHLSSEAGLLNFENPYMQVAADVAKSSAYYAANFDIKGAMKIAAITAAANSGIMFDYHHDQETSDTSKALKYLGGAYNSYRAFKNDDISFIKKATELVQFIYGVEDATMALNGYQPYLEKLDDMHASGVNEDVEILADVSHSEL